MSNEVSNDNVLRPHFGSDNPKAEAFYTHMLKQAQRFFDDNPDLTYVEVSGCLDYLKLHYQLESWGIRKGE